MPTDKGDQSNVAENTPLLTDTTSRASASDSSALEDGQTRTRDGDKDDVPLPKLQIFLLCYARLIEPIAFFSIFPYINKMIWETGDIDEADVGFYSGLIVSCFQSYHSLPLRQVSMVAHSNQIAKTKQESMFSLTQMLLMISWGRAADRIGRKPVLVFSLAGVGVATSLFGLSKTIWQMVLFRCLAGVFAGTVVQVNSHLLG